MRIFFFIIPVLILFCFAATVFAVETSDCVIVCTNEKRSNDTLCPPAGETTLIEHNLCIKENIATYNICIKNCIPTLAPSDASPAAPTMPPTQTIEPSALDNK